MSIINNLSSRSANYQRHICLPIVSPTRVLTLTVLVTTIDALQHFEIG